MSKINLVDLELREKMLNQAVIELKQRFVGIDSVIDELIESIKVWYLMPQIMQRPLIINLWGMTGVGKTDLIRHLVKLLKFQEKFLEIELNNSSQSSYFSYFSSIGEILEFNNILPDEPNILLFDEIQRFRTIDSNGTEIKDLKYQDFWELLSDGKLARRDKGNLIQLWQDLEFKSFIEKSKAKSKTGEESESQEKDFDYYDKYTAKNMREALKSKKSLQEIAGMDTEQALSMVRKAINEQEVFEASSFNQTLIIVCGNIDEAYSFAGMTSEAEIDPDIFHALTNKISLVDIKHALAKRFRPEQVSRLGNIHLLYPSLNKASFQKLIQMKIDEMLERLNKEYEISVDVDQSIGKLIYDNGVFPVQGVRPVFSTISDIFEKYLTHFLFTAMRKSYSSFKLSYDSKQKRIVADFNDGIELEEVKYVGRVDKVRQVNSENLVSMVSVHESAHAVIYALEFGLAPIQLKSRIASVTAEGFTFSHQIHMTKQTILQQINTLLAGGVAEKLVFGEENLSTGYASDLSEATRLAAEFVRKYGFDPKFKTVISTGDNANISNTSIEKTNSVINELITRQELITRKLLQKNMAFLVSLSKRLKATGELTSEEFQKVAVANGVKCQLENESYIITPPYEDILNKL
ncbi:MAG: hypothetical protein OHK0017_10360 [Patescibacteria group bacterium]